MLNPMSLLQTQAKYGEIHNGVWGNEAYFCKLIQIPDDIALNWINTATGLPTHHIYGNRDLEPILLQALQNLKTDGTIQELKTFDGCFCIRDVRAAPGVPSMHSWGLAIDLNAKMNPMGHPASFTPGFIRAFLKAGFVWGGSFRRCDPMHFSLGF